MKKRFYPLDRDAAASFRTFGQPLGFVLFRPQEGEWTTNRESEVHMTCLRCDGWGRLITDDLMNTVRCECQSIPAPLKRILDTFKAMAHNPALYRAATDALHLATVEMACDVEMEPGPCPSCGAGPADLTTNTMPVLAERRMRNGWSTREEPFCLHCGARYEEPEEPINPFKGYDPDGGDQAWYRELESRGISK